MRYVGGNGTVVSSCGRVHCCLRTLCFYDRACVVWIDQCTIVIRPIVALATIVDVDSVRLCAPLISHHFTAALTSVGHSLSLRRTPCEWGVVSSCIQIMAQQRRATLSLGMVDHRKRRSTADNEAIKLVVIVAGGPSGSDFCEPQLIRLLCRHRGSSVLPHALYAAMCGTAHSGSFAACHEEWGLEPGLGSLVQCQQTTHMSSRKCWRSGSGNLL